ncbi:hypothetical protein HHK36_003049 [Tetracentron sinense]|uniref:B box-type domain-containing protein n=1 Tax=Tetracentron sinense TaxID=13715 RepID=A0A835DNB1_TETSI|nr:hypothetical protein HHK36_003049 [Tetracentron sinense]
MKIQCDVCNKYEASVFCSADEAALCNSCDHRVHYANKLAVKHNRFSLLHPSGKEAPRCDERRAFLFCQEDRAILCRECDLPIHTANEHTQKHNRFLLTGVKLSSTSSSGASDASSVHVDYKLKINNSQLSIMKKPVSVSDPEPYNPPLIDKTTTASNVHDHPESEAGSTSSISEYLIETLPGWHVEDFLDPHGFCKVCVAPTILFFFLNPTSGAQRSVSNVYSFSQTDDLLPFLDANLESNLASFSSEDLGIWVPQVTPPPHLHICGQNGFKEATKVSRKWSHDGFTVPQINPPSSKRSKFFW